MSRLTFFHSAYAWAVRRGMSPLRASFLLRWASPLYAGRTFVPAIEELPEAEVVRQLAAAGWKIDERAFPFEEFSAYFRRIDYLQRYPHYSKQYHRSITRKAIEHFVSFELFAPMAGKTFLDVAASTSPVTRILRDIYGFEQVYRQDLNFTEDQHKKDPYTLVSDATKIPLADGSVDAISLHNSWEHFEGAADTDFLREAGRLLRPGGRLCILPIDFSRQTTVLTSPGVWFTKYRNVKTPPVFDPRAVIFIREQKLQRQEKLWSPSDFASAVKVPGMTFGMHYYPELGDEAVVRQKLAPDCQHGVLSMLATLVLCGEKF
jgi:ubiquinone/menaquinone biosynthesis C-methylase UbiE